METVNLPSQPSVQSFWKKSILIGIAFFILGGILGGVAVGFGLKLNQPLEKPAVQPEKIPQLPITASGKILVGEFSPVSKTDASPKILSVSKEGRVAVYDPKTEKFFELFLQAYCCGGTLYIGETSPFLSSTHQRIAYINKEDGNIWISDSEGNNKIKVSTQGIAESELFWGTNLSLAGWSEDERWLVYHVEIANGGMGINPEDKLNPPVPEGFYAADLQEGKIYLLVNLPNFVDFIPRSNLIVFIKEQRREQTIIRDLYTYNVITGEVEKLTKENIKGTSTGQFSFSSDNKHFAYVIGGTEPSVSELIYASLDNLNRRSLAKGEWAEIQFPKISPDGKLIAYEKYTPGTCPDGGEGCPEGSLVIYNLETNQEKTVAPIKKILYWFDNNRIVVVGGSYLGPWTLQLVDITNGTTKTIAENEELRGR